MQIMQQRHGIPPPSNHIKNIGINDLLNDSFFISCMHLLKRSTLIIEQFMSFSAK